MMYILGLTISAMIWLFKGTGSIKESYNSGKTDFLNIVKGETDVNSK